MMTKYLKIVFVAGIVLGALITLLFHSTPARAALNILTGQGGGTGIATTTAGNIGKCPQVATVNPLTYTLGTCSGGSSFPFTQTSYGVATGTTIGLLNGFIATASSTITAPLWLTSTTTFSQLVGTSTAAGGDNNFDSTGRITLTSYQKAENPNNYGEVMRIMLASTTAKGMIAWYDATTTSPLLKAWIGYHYAPNDPSDAINPHDHISIETPDADGFLRSRLEVLATNADTTQINTFNSNFTVIQGVNGVSGTDGNAKPFSIYLAGTGRNKTLRWSLQGNSTLESGSNVGSDFQINRYTDAGAFADAPFFIKRSTGNVGVGSSSPLSKLSVELGSNANGLVVQNITAGGNTAANIVAKAQTSSSRAFQAGLQTDTTNRFSVEVSGLMEWGPGGSTARDTNLYRSTSDTLKTDDLFVSAAGLLSVSSSTIGDGSQTGGLTVSGGATTTGRAYFAGNVTMGNTENSTYPLQVVPASSATVQPVIGMQNINGGANGGVSILFGNSSSLTAKQAGIGSLRTNLPNSGNTALVFVNNNPMSSACCSFSANGGVQERMRINGTGNIGVSSTTPFGLLSIHAQTYDTATILFAIGSSTASATTTHFQVKNDGTIFAPNTTSSSATQTGYWCYDANGQLIRDTTTCLVSARKFKRDIVPLGTSLQTVLAMLPVTYYEKNPLGPDAARQQVGFIADDAESLVPSLVTHDSTGAVHGFNYEQYTAYLTKAIQEQQQEIEMLEVGTLQVARSVEENYQWIIITLLALGFCYQQYEIRKLKK